jgi:alpha-1,3-rhamnosyltransferase
MSDLNPLVSVIVITYNSAKYVAETLDSVYQQEYENIELLITDDCSSDDTIEKVLQWLEKNKDRFKRVEVIRSPVNTGTPSNCNRGVKSANGDWIKIIAGDDILLEECVKTYVEETEKNPGLKFITSGMLFINNSSVPITNTDLRFEVIRRYFFTLKPEKQLKLYARLPVFINAPSFFINAAVLKETGYFDEEFFIHEDMPLIFSMLEHGIGIFHIKKETVKYRINDSSQSRTGTSRISTLRRNEQIQCFNKYQKKHLKKSNIIDIFVFYDFWLKYKYKGISGYKGLTILNLINFYPCYLNYLKFRYKKI